MKGRPLDIAIVGMSCRFPGAPDLCSFWENIVAGRSAIGDLPPGRWAPSDFDGPLASSHDRVSTQRGGYLDEPIPFDAASFGIMPQAVEGGEPEQYLVLEAAQKALHDAGLDGGVPMGHRVEVVVGRGNYFNRGNLTRLQHGRIAAQTIAILRAVCPDMTDEQLASIRVELKKSLPPFESSTISGQLTNATAGLVANRLNLTGASYVVDAASASSLVALDLGARALADGRADLSIVGAVYISCDVDFPMVFSKLGALSPTGQIRPFSRDADGTLTGEGVGVVVLKRLRDAERDCDRIYAVLKGVGISSDGRGAALTAPSARGHARSMRLAYRNSGVDPASVGLIEGHGLGVPAADRAELKALHAVFSNSEDRVLGAVSSMIGHAMPAAGMAGLIKASLSLYHRLLPPSIGSEKANPLLEKSAAFRTHAATQPWIHGEAGSPRRAGVNAFGFSGINGHAVLEAHASHDLDRASGCLLNWDSEAFLLAATSRESLLQKARGLLEWLVRGPRVTPKDLAYTLNRAAEGTQGVRLGLVAASLSELGDRLRTAVERLSSPSCRSLRDSRGVYFWEEPLAATGGLALLFPGEGSQYSGMLADLCLHFPEIIDQFDVADRIGRGYGSRMRPSRTIFGKEASDDANLWSMGPAINAVLSSQWALYQLLMKLGIRADAVAGHSSGEFLALAASGATKVDRRFEDGLARLGYLFEEMEANGDVPSARLAAIGTNLERVEQACKSAPNVKIAIDNCPHQVVIAGPEAEIDRIVLSLRGEGVVAEILPFERAYHTSDFASVVAPIRNFFGSLDLHAPSIPIYSCATARPMPTQPRQIHELAVEQWSRRVRFRETVEAMHADGLRIFVDVGARGNLASFVEDALRGKPSFAVATNLPRRSGLLQLNHLVASLFAQGVALKTDHLYARRRPEKIDLERQPMERPSSTRLTLGFPEMTLSADFLNTLDRPEPSQLPPSPRRELPYLSSFHSKNGGEEHLPSSTKFAPFTPAHPSPAYASFLSTMTSFRETQVSILEAYEAHIATGTTAERGAYIEPDFLPANRSHANIQPGPWAGQIVEIEGKDRVVTHYLLDAATDPVARNHTLGGRRVSAVDPDRYGLAVVPFAVMAEMLAQVASILSPDEELIALEKVVANKWIQYENEPVLLEILAIRDPEFSAQIRTTIFNRGPLDRAKVGDPPVVTGVAVFAEHRPPGSIAPDFELPDAGASIFDAERLYGEQWLFHGEAFQAVVEVGEISDLGIQGKLSVLPRGPLLADPDTADRLVTDPIILDAFTHLLGCWGLDRLSEGDVVFPLKMGRLSLLGDAPEDLSRVDCRIKISHIDHHLVRLNAQVVREDGTLWMTIEDWEDWRFHWPGRYRDVFRRPDVELVGELLPLTPIDQDTVAVWLQPPADMGKPVWRDVLEQIQMSPFELHSLAKGPEDRRSQRLWGRIAAKEACRRLWAERGLGTVFPADLSIEPDRYGRPLLNRLNPSFCGDIPALTIAHTQGVALGLATLKEGARPGIDVELIAHRSPEFESLAFAESERDLLLRFQDDLRDEWIARLWCAKEAAGKATGLGLISGPKSASVTEIRADGTVLVQLGPELAGISPGLRDPIMLVTTGRKGDYAWAWTLGERVG